MILSYECFYILYGKKIPKTRTSGFNNFGNIFFTIASNIYVKNNWLPASNKNPAKAATSCLEK